MPIYEYKCASCGHKKDVLQKMSDAPLQECPACGKATLIKLISAAGFQLKGSGWYATDFKGGQKTAKPDQGASDVGSKADSKPAAETKAGAGEKSEGDSKPRKEEAKTETKADAPASSAGASVAGQ